MSPSTEKPISIDGSVLEGGGQVLRVAVALAGILRKPVNVFNIRKGRNRDGKRDGLKRQHLKGLELVTKVTQGTIEGCKDGSREITFYPGKIMGGRPMTCDAETAGSVALMLQVAMPVLLFAPERTPTQLTLKGGTNCDMAPQIDYIDMVILIQANPAGAPMAPRSHSQLTAVTVSSFP